MIPVQLNISIINILEGGMQSNGNRRPSVVLINIPCCPAVAVTDRVSTFRFGNPTVPNFSKIFRCSVCGCAIAIDYLIATRIEQKLLLVEVSIAFPRLSACESGFIQNQFIVFQ